MFLVLLLCFSFCNSYFCLSTESFLLFLRTYNYFKLLLIFYYYFHLLELINFHVIVEVPLFLMYLESLRLRFYIDLDAQPSPSMSSFVASSPYPQRLTVQTRSHADGLGSLFQCNSDREGFLGQAT